MGQGRGKPTALAVSVLALLEERPMHPYEMYQTLIERREDMLVKVRPGSLYHTVARLADQELVRAEGVDRAGNRPERTTYRITPRGRAALRDRITDILRAPVPEYPEFPLALAEAHNLPAEEVLALLGERIAHLDHDLADLDAMIAWAERKGIARRYWLVLPYLRATVRAQRDWLAGFTAELAAGEPAWEEFEPTGARRTPAPATPWDGDEADPPPAPRRAHAAQPPSPSIVPIAPR
ncbi:MULTISPECIES: PadR family transcriptional regulator [Nocardia]|nr:MULTISPECIES: PadR family transcriptional regulator [Nocardia]MBA4858910.1 PadR family transcriptional regulator [Nocardia farcinica]MBC9816728.1 PadR family transcriptional regulator [Nocardia farcinica]MBF6069158.1 PadR family transcriptional regulator [Nocardia farcinica]MBF6142313.1 PadR family transcriptional regulator [Nocardia farcinica]MBF6187775.1 PadR family transcriptional regulator [Nocardia farcinica]